MEDFLEALVKFNVQATGRDRLIRLFQYSSKLLGWCADKCKYEKETIKKLNNLENSLGTGRKLLRFGRSLDTFYGALKTIHLQNLTLRLTLTLAKINQALYLLMDHILWLGKVGLFDFNNAKWARRANKFWLLSIILLLARDMYELWHIMTVEMRLRSNCVILPDPNYPFTMASSPFTLGYRHTPSTCAPLREEFLYSTLAPISRWAIQHKDVVLDTLKNACDLLLPLNGLGYTKFSNGLIAICGVVSSLVGILTLVNPACRLQP